MAFKASSIRNFFSFNSVSVAAPTLITATPPDNFAKRSCNFSRSKSLVVSCAWERIKATRLEINSFEPAPSTIVVLSLETTTFPAVPNCAKVASFNSKPKSSVMTWAPVNTAISSNIALRRSPNPGALTATTLNVPRNLFKTNVGNASPSTSSAIINNARPCWTICSNNGIISWILETFLSVIKINGLSKWATILSLSVTIYWDK